MLRPTQFFFFYYYWLGQTSRKQSLRRAKKWRRPVTNMLLKDGGESAAFVCCQVTFDESINAPPPAPPCNDVYFVTLFEGTRLTESSGDTQRKKRASSEVQPFWFNAKGTKKLWPPESHLSPTHQKTAHKSLSLCIRDYLFNLRVVAKCQLLSCGSSCI